MEMKIDQKQLIFKNRENNCKTKNYDKYLISIGKKPKDNSIFNKKRSKYSICLEEGENLRINHKYINPNKYTSLKYDNKESHKIKLFSKSFVRLNIKRCKIIKKNKIEKLKEYLDLSNSYIKDKIINIKIKLYDFLIMSKTFCDCSSLRLISDISMKYITEESDLSYIFYNCSSLNYVPDISMWNTTKIYDMSYAFYNCSTLLFVPPKLNWNTSNVSDMSYMFYNCSSLNYLPDI